MALKVIGKKTVSLAQLNVTVFVRKELNSERVQFFRDLYEAGSEVENIKCIDNGNDVYGLVEGRHRKEALHLAGFSRTDIDIVKIDANDEVQIISEAYKANLGGALPPTPADTEHTITLLIERKEGVARIAELLSLPPSMVRKYVAEVKSRLNRAKLQRAAAAVTDGGLTVKEAALRNEVDEKALKELLDGRVSKKKEGVSDYMRLISTSYKSASGRNYKFIKKMMEQYQDGDAAAKDVNRLLAHITGLQQSAAKSLEDWKKRFEAVSRGK